jgi:fumarate hydratase class I
MARPGQGCAPGAVGVCIGGDRTSGYTHAKEQLFRTLDDFTRSAARRARSVDHGDASTISKIGTMGFRRQGDAHRLQDSARRSPAGSFFVSVAYDCWAFRRPRHRHERDDRRESSSGSNAIQSTR